MLFFILTVPTFIIAMIVLTIVSKHQQRRLETAEAIDAQIRRDNAHAFHHLHRSNR